MILHQFCPKGQNQAHGNMEKVHEILRVWMINILAVGISLLPIIKEVLGVVALILSIAYTVWQWYHSYKKKKGNKDGISSK